MCNAFNRSIYFLTEACLENPCTRPGEMCDVTREGEARCRCAHCGHEAHDPVCGLVDDVMLTLPNLCQLKRSACLENKTYTLLHVGHCKGITFLHAVQRAMYVRTAYIT